MIPALVLTAGLATRLRPLSLVRAKAAIPVAGEPIVRRILRALRAAGVRDAVLNLHHLPHTIACVAGDGSDLDIRLRYSWEMPVLGSAGGPRQALPLLDDSTFLIVNGDTLTDVDIPALVADHQRSGALVTMAVVPHDEPEKYGGVLVDADGAVAGFTPRGGPSGSFHFIGIQVADARAFASVPPGAVAESVGALYPALISARRGAVRASVCRAEFCDVGTPSDYLRASLLLARREPQATLRGARTRIDGTARVEDSVVWDDVEVGAGALIRRSVVTDRVQVPAGTTWIGVTLRRANGELAPGEQQVGDLAVASL
ncbi:MAG: NDP-sugar synthase [Acidobacteria bacterium]|nr:NDP-sugar synthase [Acidobacteriota bacterium]